jgi:outer membrane lipoprotein-sorting protein
MQSWMGSDFTNDDLVKESSLVNDYTHKILGQETVDGHPICQIELTPKPEAAVIWGKILRWVRKDDFIPTKEEYYNERGKLIKILEFSDIGQVSDRVIPRTWTMTSLTKDLHTTAIKLIDVQYNIPVDDSIFALSNLTKIQ